MFTQKTHAQIESCSGNSGDPIFTEDFDTGVGFNALSIGTTTYGYNGSYPLDGLYTVSNGTFENPYNWHETEDHTPSDTNGKCLIVNVNTTAAGEFYRTTVSGLCSNTTYEFSAWLLNLVRAGSFCFNTFGSSDPVNVRFEIWDAATDTILLRSGDTGDINESFTPIWEEYGLVFNTGSETSVILKMINNGIVTVNCGNDLAIDDIEFKTCGDLTTAEDATNNTSISICSNQTPYATTLIAVPDNSVFLTHFYQWQNSTDGIFWNDIAGETSPGISISGVTNTTYYRSKVSEASTTLNDPLCNTLSDVYQLTVIPATTPNFIQVVAICNGDTLSPLPTTSNESITGSWSPAIDNTATTTYIFTPDAGQCATTQTMIITVNTSVTPTFTQVAAICSGDTLSALPTTSNNSITGSWSPAIDNTATTTYIFTPDAGQCAITQTMTITVNMSAVPTFTQVEAICNGDLLTPLPTTSNNSITGTWSPALDNTTTTTYTFTRDGGFCPSTVSLTIEVYDNPSFSLQDEFFLCFDINGIIALPVTIDTGLSTTAYNFTWLLNGAQIAGANQGTYMPIEGGNYEVIVQNAMTTCESSMLTIVTDLSEPEFEAEVITAAFSENQTVQVTTISSGDFEYQLDGGSWQDDSVFNNVSFGEHIVTVRDKRGCIESSQKLVVIGYPKFFTPNDDGSNDTWNINSISDQVNAKISIFNRYGKLLKQISPAGEGWSGLYSGRLMAVDDYWFVLEYNDTNTGEKKMFKAHFTLKR